MNKPLPEADNESVPMRRQILLDGRPMTVREFHRLTQGTRLDEPKFTRRVGLKERHPIEMGFVPIDLSKSRDGRSWYDLRADEYPTVIYTFHEQSPLLLPEGSTYYGLVTRGTCKIGAYGPQHVVDAGMFFCLPGPLTVQPMGNAQGLVIERCQYQGFPQIGGPLEPQGRLKYIDGCSDTLLICPPVVGEPCLNHLHIPPGTNQTPHTHPSQRIGVIVRGSGYCLTPYDGTSEIAFGQMLDEHPDGSCWVKTELREGMGWWIPTGLLHSFHTGEDEFLDVIAWHPDSDFGPRHDDHPMVNRTYVNDVSAREIDRIRTTQIAG
jgi:hypothetical protein